jgi:TRAP-type C4-dicarboxylate transport system permease small subunit
MNLMRLLLRFSGLLVLPLAVLLFAQWPLRDLVQAYSRQTNDVAQIVFALYMAVAITAASIGHTHLAALHSTHVSPATTPRWKRWALLLCVGPWALFMLWATTPIVVESVRHWEKFGETLTPGYFLIKVALALLVILVLIEALLQVMPHAESES